MLPIDRRVLYTSMWENYILFCIADEIKNILKDVNQLHYLQ